MILFLIYFYFFGRQKVKTFTESRNKIRNAWKGIFKWNITHFFPIAKECSQKQRRERELNQKTFRKTKCIAAHFSKKANLLFCLVTDKIPESFLKFWTFHYFLNLWHVDEFLEWSMLLWICWKKIKKSWFRGYPKIRFQVSYIWH